jgi:hypothetical protein
VQMTIPYLAIKLLDVQLLSPQLFSSTERYNE